jgi:hypothetical protein
VTPRLRTSGSEGNAPRSPCRRESAMGDFWAVLVILAVFTVLALAARGAEKL